jgi:glycosyltransferase involved in cell wall biosynthesis
VRTLVLVGPLPPPYYGQSVSFRMLVDEVEGRGVPCRVVNLAYGEGAQQKMGLLSVHRVLDYLAILARYARAAAFGRKSVYLTIAQSRQGFLRDCVMIWFAALFGHRVVVHLKGGNYDNFYAAQPGWMRGLIRATLRRVSRVLVLGERLRSMFDFEPALRDRVHVVPNGLPEDRDPGIDGKPLPDAGPIRLVYLSNLVETKGWLELLEAVALLRDRLGEGRVRCDFYGQFLTNPADDVRVASVEQARSMFDDAVARHRLENTVAHHGVVAGAEKRAALEGGHFFVLATRYVNEGQPVSIIEAMAYGNVVVSTDYRAIPDMVRDGETGALVPYGEPAAIADAVERIVREPGRFEAMSRAAVARYRERFTRRAHLRTILPHLTGDGAPPPRVAAGAAE